MNKHHCGRFTFLAAILLVSCSAKNDGSEFVGRWKAANAAPGALAFEIRKTGNTYLFIDQTNAQFPGTYDPQTHVLTMSMPLLGQVPFSYDASTHKLHAMDDEFQKVGTGGSADAGKSGGHINKLNDGALAFGKGLMAPNLTVCGGRTFAMLSEGDRAAAPWLGEIKDPAFEVASDAVSQADGLNGIDFHGSVDLRWSAYRIFQRGQWTQWVDANDSLIGASVAGSERVFILHKNGQWVHDDSYFGKQDFAGLRRKPISCDSVPKA